MLYLTTTSETLGMNSKMAVFFKERIGLIAIVLLFVALKIPHLNVPFYWDECWPYASAIRRMFELGPTLLPGSLPEEYSRGHPLLFHFLASAWMKIWDTSSISMHSFSLMVACSAIIIVYETGLRIFNKLVAFNASLLVAFQVLFFVQATFLLPEVLLAALGMLTIFAYSSRRNILLLISLSLLLLTKESGLILGFVLGVHALIQLVRNRAHFMQNLVRILMLIGALVPFVLFFLLQYQHTGWLIFPVHENLIDTGSQDVFQKIKSCFTILFISDLRAYQWLVLLVCVIAIIVIRRRITINTAIWNSAKQGKLLILCSGLFVVAFMLFSSFNILISRYLLVALLPLLLILSVLISTFAEQLLLKRAWLSSLAIAAILAIAFAKDRGHNDSNLGAYNAMKVQQGIVDFLEKRNAFEAGICSDQYLQRIILTDPYTGYLSSEQRVFHAVSEMLQGGTQFVILTNIEPEGKYGFVKSDSTFKLVYTMQINSVWGEVYERIK